MAKKTHIHDGCDRSVTLCGLEQQRDKPTDKWLDIVSYGTYDKEHRHSGFCSKCVAVAEQAEWDGSDLVARYAPHKVKRYLEERKRLHAPTYIARRTHDYHVMVYRATKNGEVDQRFKPRIEPIYQDSTVELLRAFGRPRRWAEAVMKAYETGEEVRFRTITD